MAEPVKDFSIKPLDSSTRAGAVALIRSVFPEEGLLDRLNVALLGTPLQFITIMLGVNRQRVWVAVKVGAVLGVTGLYEDEDDAPAAEWLGWFCVSPQARGRGIGAALLDFSIAEARRTGKPFLRLYTSNDEAERSAQALYESRGLRIVKQRTPMGWDEGELEYVRELRIN